MAAPDVLIARSQKENMDIDAQNFKNEEKMDIDAQNFKNEECDVNDMEKSPVLNPKYFFKIDLYLNLIYNNVIT